MYYRKLVRDNIPEILDKKNIPYNIHIADNIEFKKELITKLQEEVNEFLIDKSSEELADVLEVIDSIKKLPEYKDVIIIQKHKRDERGGFSKKIILEGDDDK